MQEIWRGKLFGAKVDGFLQEMIDEGNIRRQFIVTFLERSQKTWDI